MCARPCAAGRSEIADHGEGCRAGHNVTGRRCELTAVIGANREGGPALAWTGFGGLVLFTCADWALSRVGLE